MAPNNWEYNWKLTLSLPISLTLYTLPYWSNPAFLIFDIRALWTERQSARMSKIKNAGLDQYGAESFEQQQFGTAGVEEVKSTNKNSLKIDGGYVVMSWRHNTPEIVCGPQPISDHFRLLTIVSTTNEII